MIEPNEVKEHYGAQPLLACIDEALRRAGLGSCRIRQRCPHAIRRISRPPYEPRSA